MGPSRRSSVICVALLIKSATDWCHINHRLLGQSGTKWSLAQVLSPIYIKETERPQHTTPLSINKYPSSSTGVCCVLEGVFSNAPVEFTS